MAFSDLIPWKHGSRTLAKSSPDNVFNALQREMNSLLDEFWHSRGTLPTPPSAFSPSITVDESAKDYRVSAEVPGLSEKDITVELAGSTLTISGEKKDERKEKRGTTVYTECCYGSFTRAIPLPGEIDRDKIKAQFKNGVLTVSLPKTAQAQAARKHIAVKAE